MTLDKDELRKGDKIIASKSEEEIYRALGLQFIEPELREGRGEITLAQKGKLPTLVTDADLRRHITRPHRPVRWRRYARSDGRGHARAGAIAISALPITHGRRTTPGTVARRGCCTACRDRPAQSTIRQAVSHFQRHRVGFLADGSLDYPDEVLAQFDFVVASVHGRFKLDRKEQTERILRAVSNPHTTILGHMTGRQLLRRPGYEVDIERILSACAKNGVAVEINANPWRLDLDWRWHQRALELRLPHKVYQSRCALD